MKNNGVNVGIEIGNVYCTDSVSISEQLFFLIFLETVNKYSVYRCLSIYNFSDYVIFGKCSDSHDCPCLYKRFRIVVHQYHRDILKISHNCFWYCIDLNEVIW